MRTIRNRADELRMRIALSELQDRKKSTQRLRLAQFEGCVPSPVGVDEDQAVWPALLPVPLAPWILNLRSDHADRVQCLTLGR